jgi:tryptophanyl-tRNA synthetase
MARVFSGIQPTGGLHLGNYVGAISRWPLDQRPEQFFCIVDLHAITRPQEPADLRARTLDLTAWLLAAGLDPDVVTLFVQSEVAEHTQLSWVLECTAAMGELGRMTQFKERSAGQESVGVGLFTYPVLQAADILLYQAEQVPVGEDQRQHIELTRDLAQRFNSRYGETFTLPRATLPQVGARIMDLQLPDRKMSKSLPPAGGILLTDDEDVTVRKIRRAVTDSGSEVRGGPDKPALSNLLELMSAVTGAPVPAIEQQYEGKGYGAFKAELAEAVNGYLRPLRLAHADLAADPGALREVLRKGADRARDVAAATLTRVWERVGFLT